MLPIPAPIIGSASCVSSSANSNPSVYQRRRFFIPLIYLGGTASLCYLFLFALVLSNENQHHHNNHNRHIHHHKRNPSGVSLLWSVRSNNSERGNHHQQHHQRGSEGKRKEEKGKASSASTSLSSASSSSAVLISELQQSSPFHRKTLHSLRKKRHHHQNGTWRSNPTQIWSGHQDLGHGPPRQDFLLKGKGGDGSRPSALSEVSSYPWIEDEQCDSFQVQFAKRGTFKPRALVSFPGSGNSWLRYLIERASGYFTGSVYNDQKLFKSGLMGELRSPNDGSTILQKTHHDTVGKRKAYLKLSELMFSYRGVLLIRNPYDALVSHWNFINNKSKDKHRGIVSKSEFDNEKWANYVRGRIPLWTSLIMSWIENSQDYLLVLYEEVQRNPRGELIRILEYLNQPVSTTRLDCLMKPEHLEGPFHRAHPPEGASSTTLADKPLLHSFPFTITSTLTTSSQQDKEIKGKVELPSSSSPPPPPHHHDHHSNEQTLFVLDSKKSQRDQQQHPQSSPPSSLLLPPPSQTITAQVREKKPEEQKEDKFLLLPTSFSSSSISPPSSSSSSTSPSLSSLSQTISSTPSKHHHQPQQNPESTSSRMTSRTIPLSNNNNHNHNDPLNNSSILRLDLIIQDNIDKINRFFQQKSIPLQLLYTLRPSLSSYYFLQPYNNYTISSSPITF